jgi:16S rRNA (cytosine1402-N4)-methyltransferase
MTVAALDRAYMEPLDQQDGSPLLHPPSPMHRERKPGAMLAEGLRMSPADSNDREPPATVSPSLSAEEPAFEHAPVMLTEVVDLFSAVPEGVVLDATVGAGGHARALLDAFPRLSVVGIDQDAEAVEAATAALASFGARALVRQGRFDRLPQLLDSIGVGALAGALFDLGVSSPQIDRPDRGFSYRYDAPLDMRMDRSQELTAARVVNESTEEQLARLFREHGETRFARRMAAALVAARPVLSTGKLAEVISSAVPAAARRRGHPAKRVFQALRVAVNSELEILPGAIDAAIERLAPMGRIVVISYHSGEDRAVKDRLVYAATGGCTCPPGWPCVCGAVAQVRLLNRGARKPSAAEVSANPRAESARLRAAEALAAPENRLRKGGPGEPN